MKHVYFFCTLLSVVWLTGCGQFWPDRQPISGKTTQGVLAGAAVGATLGATGGTTIAAGTAMGAVLGGAFASYISRNDTLVDQLRWSGVDIIFVGEDVKFVLPADRFFQSKGTGVDPAYYAVLNGIANMINHYEKVTVKVGGFTDSEGDGWLNVGRSTAQAQSIADYLRHQDIDARIIYAIGYGDQSPIAQNKTGYGRAYNRRIEVTLRRIPEGPIV